MVTVGEMVVAHQRLMKLVAIEGGTAVLKFIDSDGVVQIRSAGLLELAPFWSALVPKSRWPDTNAYDEFELAREEAKARAAKKAKAKASRKATRSLKAKLKVAI